MPWSSSEASSHTKAANTPKKRRQWANVANSVLKKTKNEGRAVKAANASVTDKFWVKDNFNEKAFSKWLDSMPGMLDCPECDGDGNIDGEPCEECGGSGFVSADQDYYDPDDPDYDDPEYQQRMREEYGYDRRTDDKATVHMNDMLVIDEGAKVRPLENGYVAAMPRIARTGIQIYSGAECGRADMDKVRVFRPPNEVFSKDTVHTYTHLPVTLDHPSEFVNSSNWRKYAVGETGDEVLRDGNAVRVPMMLRDAEAIKGFRNGTNQLSVGYDCELEWRDGVTKDGEHYDAIQHDIRANHLAVVAAARGGPALNIGDDDVHHLNNGDTTMNLKMILVDGLEVHVADSAATVIQRTISNFETRLSDTSNKLKDAETKLQEATQGATKKDDAIKAKDVEIAEVKKSVEAKDGELAELKKQLEDAKKAASPTALDTLARERTSVILKARQLVGDKIKVDGMSVADIRKHVVEARLGETCKGWSDERIEGAFAAMQTNAFSGNDPALGTTFDDAVQTFSGRPGPGYGTPRQARDAAYADYDRELTGAYRGPAKTAATE